MRVRVVARCLSLFQRTATPCGPPTICQAARLQANELRRGAPSPQQLWAERQPITREDREQLAQAITYFDNKRQYMKYDEYLAAGFPIGSGVAEGACRHVVKDRLEQTGMRWTEPGAQAMLHLRAVYINGDWDE